jgi:ABC-2 type transport system permease protein
MDQTLRGIWIVARRDLAAYFHSAWGWVIVAAVLFLNGLLFNAFALGDRPRYSHEVLELFFYFSSGTTMVAAIFLTMRLIAEERQTGTDVLLEGAPLRDGAIVAGKYLSAMVFLTLLIALSVYMPALIFVNGKVGIGHIAAGYVGLLGIGSAAVAMGTFGSSLAKSQVVAAVVGGAILVALLVCWLLARVTGPPFAAIFEHMSLFDRHFRPFMQGRIQSDALVYYGSLTLLFLFATTRVLSWRRWR